jgi:hypothetical protein
MTTPERAITDGCTLPMAEPKPTDERAETSATDPEVPPAGVKGTADEYLDEQEDESFPASDPHSDWAGPAT